MKEICLILLFALSFIFFVNAQQYTQFDNEHSRLMNAKRIEVEDKYRPDTSALLKVFLDNVPIIIKNLQKIEIPDSVNERFPEGVPKYYVKELYDELLAGNVNEIRSIMLQYNKRIERSLVLHDSLSAYILASFLPLYRVAMLSVFYYTADYKVIQDNSKLIMEAANRHFDKQKEFDKLEEWSSNEYKKAGLKPRDWLDTSYQTWWYGFRLSYMREDTLSIAFKVLLSNKQERAELAKDTAFVRRYVGNQLHLQALLGNKKAEDKLIQEYKADTTFDGRREKLRQLVFVNSPKTIKAVVSSFNDEIYDAPCSAYVRVSIINELSRLYPDEKILRVLTETEFLNDRPKYPFQDRNVWASGKEPEEWSANYVRSVLDWIKNKFNIIPNGGNKTLRLQKNDIGCANKIPIFD